MAEHTSSTDASVGVHSESGSHRLRRRSLLADQSSVLLSRATLPSGAHYTSSSLAHTSESFEVRRTVLILKAQTPLHVAFDPSLLVYPAGTFNMSTLTYEGRLEQAINGPQNLHWLPEDVHKLYDKHLIHSCPYQRHETLQVQHGQGEGRFMNLRSLGLGIGRRSDFAREGGHQTFDPRHFLVFSLFQTFAALSRYNFNDGPSQLPPLKFALSVSEALASISTGKQTSEHLTTDHHLLLEQGFDRNDVEKALAEVATRKQSRELPTSGQPHRRPQGRRSLLNL